jgi:hypothetical protein
MMQYHKNQSRDSLQYLRGSVHCRAKMAVAASASGTIWNYQTNIQEDGNLFYQKS